MPFLTTMIWAFQGFNKKRDTVSTEFFFISIRKILSTLFD